ncbi:hypothetical protein [Paenibacillus sp. Marseille-Q4541]|uniref:hypothetical protein n=1 Tax=Paenibacillus sp. Marseille-Q4541 TaxID=2831522 RepID=UPI001BABDB2E|nr:hypothetical protein [Paenibacillus sp. Marseille-Q4541]
MNQYLLKLRIYADYLGWDKLTKDGCSGKFVEGRYANEELAEKGKVFWNTYIDNSTKGLKEILEEAYRRKMQE